MRAMGRLTRFTFPPFCPLVSFPLVAFVWSCLVFVDFALSLFSRMETKGPRGFTLLVHPTEMVPHDRQGLTARSATRKKKKLIDSCF